MQKIVLRPLALGKIMFADRRHACQPKDIKPVVLLVAEVGHVQLGKLVVLKMPPVLAVVLGRIMSVVSLLVLQNKGIKLVAHQLVLEENVQLEKKDVWKILPAKRAPVPVPVPVPDPVPVLSPASDLK